MAESITITIDDIKNAATYIDLTTKEELTRAIASMCIEPVEVKVDETESLPTMFRENRKLRQQFQMGILASMLGRPYEQQPLRFAGSDETHPLPWCMEEAEYDRWASSHVMNQLERLKKTADKALLNTIFDLLYDYKATELMLTGAIRDALEIRNDAFNRAMQYFFPSVVQTAMKSVVDGALRDFKESRSENDG